MGWGAGWRWRRWPLGWYVGKVGGHGAAPSPSWCAALAIVATDSFWRQSAVRLFNLTVRPRWRQLAIGAAVGALSAMRRHAPSRAQSVGKFAYFAAAQTLIILLISLSEMDT